MKDLGRCAVCDKMVNNSELKKDKEGWKRFAPACKICYNYITPKGNIDVNYLNGLFLEPDIDDEAN